MKLLLAEDDLFQCKVLSKLLGRAGHEVHAVSGGEEALQRLSSGEFQFLITDWDMPGMDGATLCTRVRSASIPHYVYILMLTGHRSDADLLAAFEAGADDYVRKPANEAELLARVKAGCRLLDSERSLNEALAQIRALSVTDSLTGLFNRRYLDEQLKREVDRAERYGRPLSLVMADLDHFKALNDQFGHAAGDAAIQWFADCLRASARISTDWAARYGGEEFVLVLPETALPDAVLVAEKVRSACRSEKLSLPGGEITVTASFGVSALRLDTHSFSAEILLKAADEALYASKRSGRNQVTRADP
jgi:two-component system cell cycle response regulator